ncbi:MAG TPA: hypothetical protein PLD49_11385, partial [Thermoclostridium caenicola]|nr:hypothetical protein [Thermoclostridium caenicola]
MENRHWLYAFGGFLSFYGNHPTRIWRKPHLCYIIWPDSANPHLVRVLGNSLIFWQGSDFMILRKMAVVLLGLSVLLSGCSPDAARDNHSQREDTVNISADANADRKVDNTESTVTDVMPADAGASEVMKEGQGGTAAEENAAGMDIADASQDEGNKIIELIPMKQLPDLTMAPQKPFTLEEAA